MVVQNNLLHLLKIQLAHFFENFEPSLYIPKISKHKLNKYFTTIGLISHVGLCGEKWFRIFKFALKFEKCMDIKKPMSWLESKKV